MYLVLDVLQAKALSTAEKYIASMHATNHVNLINNISSKDNYYQNHTTDKFHYIYFNNDCSESAFLAAGFVIYVI